MELAHTDVLALIAEVSATFVGFSLAIGLLQANQPGAKLRKQAMHSVAELAMISCAGALVVLVVQTFGLSAETTWRVGSGCAALFWGATFAWALVRYAEAGHSALKDKRVKYAAAISVLGIGLFIANITFPTQMIGAIHIVGLFLALVLAGYLFLLSTFLINADENAG
nr:hypothetical protein [uncultured bacterium]